MLVGGPVMAQIAHVWGPGHVVSVDTSSKSICLQPRSQSTLPAKAAHAQRSLSFPKDQRKLVSGGCLGEKVSMCTLGALNANVAMATTNTTHVQDVASAAAAFSRPTSCVWCATSTGRSMKPCLKTRRNVWQLVAL